MEQNLQSFYESHYLRTGPSKLIVESQEDAGDEDTGKQKAKGKKKAGKKKENIGGITYDSTNFENAFNKLLREMDEEFGAEDNVFDGDGDLDDIGGEDEQITVSKATLQSIIDQLQDLIGGFGGEDEFADDGFGDDGFGDDDDVPLESYGQTGGGAHHGDQGTYDGKAKKQGASTLVKGNGNAEFGKQDTGYSPDDTEGSEGAEHGDQGTYDGKAKKQGQSDHVKGNGDANIGKSQRTGYKTGSGKKEKDLF